MARWLALFCAAGLLCAAALAQDPACELFRPGSSAAPSSSCLSCHRADAIGNHRVDIDYARATLGSFGLRPVDEVIRRGVKLPDGHVRCATCHDARSPWKYRLALPPGTKATLAVDPQRPETYDGHPRHAPQPGDAVTAKPLCLACHALD
jgi:hypothetical protein